MVRDARKAYLREVKVPKELAQRIAKLETSAYGVRGGGVRGGRRGGRGWK